MLPKRQKMVGVLHCYAALIERETEIAVVVQKDSVIITDDSATMAVVIARECGGLLLR